jgi:hypothetical protein
MASPPGSPPISPDGHYWWDGQAWQPMPAAAPAPAPAPAAVEAAPSWLAAPPAASAAPAPAAVAYQPQPAYEQQAYQAQYDPAPAAWMAPEPPRSRTMTYVIALVLIGIVGAGGYLAYQMTAQNNYTASVQASPSPTISDYERADRFLNVDLLPALQEVNNAVPTVNKNCNSTLPPACKDALITLNTAMIDLGNAITNNQKDIPICIGTAVSQFQNDWQTMEQGLTTAIQGFSQNNRTLIIDGLQRYAEVGQFLKPDVDRINAAEKTCSKTL